MTDTAADDLADVLIVGAGPYGLSTGAHASRLGLRTRVVGRPMLFWERHMPRGMLLKSEPFASGFGGPGTGLSYLDYCHERGDQWARIGQPIPLDRFVAYGRWYAHETLPGAEDATVRHLERAPGGYRAVLSTGEVVAAPAVVVAVGVGDFAHVPDELAGLPPALVSHSSALQDPAEFAGRRVAVVGAGQSALETAALLAEAGARPVVLARGPQLAWNAVPVPDPSRLDRLRGPHSGLGTGWRTWVWSQRPQAVRYLPGSYRRRIVRTTLGPAGSWWLRERLAGAEVLLGRRVVQARELRDRVELTLLGGGGAPASVTADHVIAATGYRADLGRVTLLGGLRGQVRTAYGSPVLSGSLESSLPGLYFAGLTAAATFGPVMRFVHGAGFAARRISAHLAAHQPGRAGERRGARV